MCQKNNYLLYWFLTFAGCVPALYAFGSETPSSPDNQWEDWAKSQVSQTESVAVQNRTVTKAGRFQIVGPLLGISDRKDFYSTYVFTAGARYHFSENHAWEFIRVNLSVSNETSLATEIREQTSFRPDAQLSRFQIGSSYVYTPIYGKYAWSSDHLIYFDIFGTAGAGVRFTNTDAQPFGELGIGMNHYIFSNRFSIVPEFRERIYAEQRSSTVAVFESTFQLGVAWLF